jgi:hypothetical protein
MPTMTIFCDRCGARCSGKLQIEARKGCFYNFCVSCFDYLNSKDLKEVRGIIRKNKHSVPITQNRNI